MSVLSKSHAILELVQKHTRTGLTNLEISRALDLPPSSCHRLLAALLRRDYLRRQGPGRRYTLGYAHLRFADSLLESLDEASICLPYLEQLHLETEETTFYARLCDTACVTMQICGYINRRVSTGRGEIMPLSCSASGMAALAFLPEGRRLALMRGLDLQPRTPSTVTDRGQLLLRLEEVRRSGVALNLGEMHPGVNAVAAPLFDAGGVLGAMAIVGPAVDLDREQMLEYREPLLRACAEATETLGGVFPAGLLAAP